MKLLERYVEGFLPRDDTLSLFWIVVSIRLVNALTIKTFFQADEYWQSLEPAHYLVYNYGYLTWEWREGLRSFIHPLLFAAVYKLCDLFDLGYPYIINLPKVLQAIITSIGEVYIYKLAYKYTSSKFISKLTLLLSLTSAFNWFCITRSFSNTAELTLTIVGLYYFPIHRNFQLGDYVKSVVIGIVSCIIRPSNSIIWVYFGVNLLLQLHGVVERLKLISITLLLSVVTLILNAVVDYGFYSNWESPLIKFLEFNVVKSLSSFYGVSRVDFYFLQAVPIIMLTYLPFMLTGLWCFHFTETKKSTRSTLLKLIVVSLVYLVVFSFIHHKEFRFVYPLKPIFLLFASYGLVHIDSRLSKTTFNSILIFTITMNVLLGYYFTQIHESGVIRVTSLLRDKVLTSTLFQTKNEPVTIGFMTPCHSTPFQSHFHMDTSVADIWFLTCEPPLHLDSTEGLSEYRDESDEFYDNPNGFISSNFPQLTYESRMEGSFDRYGSYLHDWPDYLVIFEHMKPFFDDLLLDSKYELDETLFNSRFHWDYRRTGDIIIYKYNEPY